MSGYVAGSELRAETVGVSTLERIAASIATSGAHWSSGARWRSLSKETNVRQSAVGSERSQWRRR